MLARLLLACCVGALAHAAPQLSEYLPPPPAGDAGAPAGCAAAEPQLQLLTETSTRLHQVTSTQHAQLTRYSTVTRNVQLVRTVTDTRTLTRSIYNTQLVHSTSTLRQPVLSTQLVTAPGQTVTQHSVSTQTATSTRTSVHHVTSTHVQHDRVVDTQLVTRAVSVNTFVPQLTTEHVTRTVFSPGQTVRVTSDVHVAVTRTQHVSAHTAVVTNAIQQTVSRTLAVRAPRRTVLVTHSQVIPITRIITASPLAAEPSTVLRTIDATSTRTVTVTSTAVTTATVTSVVTRIQPRTRVDTVTLRAPVTSTRLLQVTRTVTTAPGSGTVTAPGQIFTSQLVGDDVTPATVQQPFISTVTSIIASPLIREVLVTRTVAADCGGYNYNQPDASLRF